MNSQIVNPSTFSMKSDVIFTKLKVAPKGNKSVGILGSNTKKPILIQTPLMMTWGVEEYENENQPTSYSINLQFPRVEDSNKPIDAFLSMIQQFEQAVIIHVSENSMEFFGKKLSDEVIRDKWKPILKYPKNTETGEADMERMPSMRMKLPIWEGKPGFDIYDIEDNILVSSDNGRTADEFVQKGCHMASIIKCGGIWAAGGNFGVTWRLYQGKVKPTESLESGVCHISLSDDELNNKITYYVDDNTDDNSDGNNKQITKYDTDEDVDPSDVPEDDINIVSEEKVPLPPKKGAKKSKK